MNIIGNVWHDISEIIFKQNKDDKDGSLRYVINPDEKTVDVYIKGELKIHIAREECAEYADGIREAIRNSHTNDGTVDMPDSYAEYLKYIGREDLKASSKDTPDIWLDMPDVRNTSNKPLGFSIKSRLSSHLPTIFNSSGASNLIYEITGEVTPEKIARLRSMTKDAVHDSGPNKGEKFLYPDYPARIGYFKDAGLGLKFVGAKTVRTLDNSDIEILDQDPFAKNLMMVDSNMGQILADMTAEVYFNSTPNMEDLVKILDSRDRSGVKPSDAYPFYRKKVQDLLVAMTTAMKAGTIWDGKEGTNGGLIIVKEDGDIVCYHIFDRNDFREFLFKNMKFEIPSNKRYYSMGIAEEDGKYFVSLNVQIRMGQKKKAPGSGYYDVYTGEYLIRDSTENHWFRGEGRRPFASLPFLLEGFALSFVSLILLPGFLLLERGIIVFRIVIFAVLRFVRAQPVLDLLRLEIESAV